MKLKNYIVINDVLDEIKDMPLNIKIAYKFSKLKTITNSNTQFYKDQLKILIQKYGIQKDDEIVVPPERIEDFQKEIDNLLDLEVDDCSISFDLEELDGIELSISNFMALSVFIREKDVD